MLITMDYRQERKEVIGGAIIFALIVLSLFALAIYLGGYAIDAMPREFGAVCSNVPGGDVCRITL